MSINSMTISQSRSAPVDNLAPLARLPALTSLVVFAPILLTMLSGRLLSPYTTAFSVAFPAYRFLLYTISNGVTIGILHLVLRQHGITWHDLGLKSFRWRDQSLALVAAAIGLFVLFPLGNALAARFGLPLSESAAFPLVDPLTWASAILFPCVLIPFAEEILFRGFLLTLLRCKVKSNWVVGLVGAFMFGMMHFGLYGMSSMLLVVTLWGILPVGLFLWSRSIWPTATLHILNNLFGLVIIPFLVH